MIGKLLLSFSLAALAACARRADGPDVDRTVLALGDSTLIITEPVRSPDGTRLAYAQQLEGVSAVFVAGTDGANPQRLTHGIWDSGPVWSPDGRWIAYYSDANGDVWVVPSAGGEARQLTSGPARDNPIGWLPDGSAVILQRAGTGDEQTLVAPLDGAPVRPLFAAPDGNVFAYPSPDGSKVAFFLGRGGRSTLWVQAAAGGPARQLTTDGLEGARRPRMWSPDGRSVLYVTRRTGTQDVWKADVETGELTQLTNDIRNDWLPSWSPDGRWVLFTSDRGGQRDLWIVPADGGAARRVTNDLAQESNADWTADGRGIVFALGREETSLQVMPADGGPARSLVTLQGYTVQDPTIAPDGGTVLFSANRSGDLDIWSVPLAGGEMTPFAASPTAEAGAQYSRDGRSVVFVSERGGTADIWVMPAGGGDARQLTDWPSSETAPRWSPDGATIAFTSTRDATQPDVWTIPAAGGEAKRITRTRGVDVGSVRWSPDGRTLFYIGASAEGQRQLFRVPASGGTPRQLTRAEGGASIFAPAVSPDGAQTAYSYLVGGLSYLEVAPAAGGPSRRFHADSTRAYQAFAVWSPDGSRIVFSDWNFETNHYNLSSIALADGTMRSLTTTRDRFEFGAEFTPDGASLVFISVGVSARVVNADVSRLLAATQP